MQISRSPQLDIHEMNKQLIWTICRHTYQNSIANSLRPNDELMCPLVQIMACGPVGTINSNNAGILPMGSLGTNFSQTVFEIQENSFKNVVWKKSAICIFLGLNVLIVPRKFYIQIGSGGKIAVNRILLYHIRNCKWHNIVDKLCWR